MAKVLSNNNLRCFWSNSWNVRSTRRKYVPHAFGFFVFDMTAEEDPKSAPKIPRLRCNKEFIVWFSMIFFLSDSKLLKNIHDGGIIKAYRPCKDERCAIISTNTVARSPLLSLYSSFTYLLKTSFIFPLPIYGGFITKA